MLKSIITTLLIAITLPVVGGINPFWVNIDMRLIKKLVSVDLDNPISVERYFLKSERKRSAIKKEKLGFGWEVWKTGRGGGYISISANIYYFRDSIISFVLYPGLPDEEELVRKYIDKYNGKFKVINHKIFPYLHNTKVLGEPLIDVPKELFKDSVATDFKNYMSPLSGIEYGYRGGLGNSWFKNRKAFINLIAENPLELDEIERLLYSINPASRFTAIEYYLKHQSRYPYKESIYNRMEVIFEEIPKVRTIIGCLGEVWDSRSLVFFLYCF